MPPAITATLLPPNPVWRSYIGGRILRRFRSLPDAEDNHFPEDWLASTVQARNGPHTTQPLEGLSLVANDGKSPLLSDILKEHPAFWFGPSYRSVWNGQNLGVLWKLLDSSV